MYIKNNEGVITNKQIKSIIELLGSDFEPNKIIVYENKRDIKPLVLNEMNHIQLGRVLDNSKSAFYEVAEKIMKDCTETEGIIHLFIFLQKGWSRHSKQFYSIHELILLLYQNKMHRYRHNKNTEEESVDFATSFMNEHSEEISEIMNWKDEWEIEIGI